VSRNLLRHTLILTAIALPPLSSLTWWLLGYGPFIGLGFDVSDQFGLFGIMAIQGLFNGITASAIGLWAAHNLKPLSFMSTKSLLLYLSLGIYSCAISFLISFFETYTQSTVYGDPFILGWGELAYSFQFIVYGVPAAALLMFARLQLKNKLAGETLREPDISETFS